MAKSNIKVIFKPGGYEAYKDQDTIRKPQWKIILIMVLGIFGFGVISAIISMLLLSQFWGKSSPQPSTSPESIVAETTQEPAFQSRVSDAMPTQTHTPTPTPTNTQIPEPTETSEFPNLQATVDFLASQMERNQVQNISLTATKIALEHPSPTLVPTATTIPSMGLATVVRCNATIRVAPGIQYKALDAVTCGTQYPILDISNGWIQVYLGDDTSLGWIRSDLLRLEMRP